MIDFLFYLYLYLFNLRRLEYAMQWDTIKPNKINMKPPYTTTPTEYLRKKQNLTQTTYIRKQGKGFYLVNGEEIPAKEWEKANELPLSLRLGKPNPDKTRAWKF